MSELATPSRCTRGAGPWESARRERLWKECVVITLGSVPRRGWARAGAAGCLGVRATPPLTSNARLAGGKQDGRWSERGRRRGVSSPRQGGRGPGGLANHGDAVGVIHHAAGVGVRRVEHGSNMPSGKAPRRGGGRRHAGGVGRTDGRSPRSDTGPRCPSLSGLSIE